MALKAKIANKVQTTEKGLVEGTILTVLEIEERTELEKGKEVFYPAQFEFQIESKGSQKNVIYRIWTRQTFNNEKYEKADGKQDYNNFTRLMIQLEMIKESDLKNLDSLSDFDVESCEGLKIIFELEASQKNRGLKIPKLTSIKPLTVPTK
jgi:hypothetical protein